MKGGTSLMNKFVEHVMLRFCVGEGQREREREREREERERATQETVPNNPGDQL